MAEGGGRRDYVEIRRLADELLPSLMARLEASALGELEVRQDGWHVRLRKPLEAAIGAGSGARHASAAGDGRPGRSARRKPGSDQADAARGVVTSPSVGTFHPGGAAGVGRAVRAGDVVGHVEVLGVPQEVLAPFDGTLGRLLVEAGQVVEYGEPLMRIESASGSAGARADPTGAA